MGNSGSSHQQQVTLVEEPPHSWAHSFPRTTSFKVLPDRVPGQRLRLTDNGAILNNGGTISGRKPYPNELQYQQGYKSGGAFIDDNDYRRTLYGSEPDLRYSQESKQPLNVVPSHQTYYSNNNNDNSVKSRIGRSRKKYKAPPVPHVNSADSSSPDSYHRWETSADGSYVTTPCRRSRLFKTRAETKRPSVDNSSSCPKYLPNGNPLQQRQQPLQMGNGAVPGRLQRSLSSPQFQDELTAKLRERAVREPPVGKAADSPHLSPVLKGHENRSQLKQQQRKAAPELSCQYDEPSSRRLHEGVVRHADNKLRLRSGTGKSHPERGHHPNGYRLQSKRTAAQIAVAKETLNEKVRAKTSIGNRCGAGTGKQATSKNSNDSNEVEVNKKTDTPVAPVKKFYFGMEADIHVESLINGESNEVDKFAASLMQSTPIITNTSLPSESFLSEKNNYDSLFGISLKLRPTLPRKQLDIPRFSPTAAWHLLSAVENPIRSEQDNMMLMEERIPHHQLTIDKSGDSGISDDASPQHQDSAPNSQIVAWTPQQDLEETSSDGGLESAPISPESSGTAKFSARFSLSLPRDERLSTPTYSDKHSNDIQSTLCVQNLNKLKRSINGALSRNKDITVSSLDENWVLSRSVPNLFNNSYIHRWSDTSPSSGEQDDDPSCSLSKPPSFSYLANGGHIMYLPEYKIFHRERQSNNLSYSCEDSTQRHQKEKHHHENGSGKKLSKNMVIGLVGNGASKLKSSRKFTFQSTIRQIERRKIAEKLSKEAGEKEKQRLRELEAMQKVEEEFQRKREREKADVKHQLRLYNLTEGSREQPDGAIGPSSSHITQVLSEFRQPRRDYRDYTPARSDLDLISHSDPGVKRETIHPKVVYKIPKNSQIYVTPHHSTSGNGNIYRSLAESPRSLSSDNYRKDFAQGALPRSVASSDSELSQPNTRPTSRTKQRSRSMSPVNFDSMVEYIDEEIAEDSYSALNDKVHDVEKNNNDEVENSYGDNLMDLFKLKPVSVMNNVILQPYNRNKTYKPISFQPFGDKIAQVTS